MVSTAHTIEAEPIQGVQVASEKVAVEATLKIILEQICPTCPLECRIASRRNWIQPKQDPDSEQTLDPDCQFPKLILAGLLTIKGLRFIGDRIQEIKNRARGIKEGDYAFDPDY